MGEKISVTCKGGQGFEDSKVQVSAISNEQWVMSNELLDSLTLGILGSFKIKIKR